MQTMLLEAIAPIESSPLRLRELAPPEPEAGQVRMQVRCCAICRTDLHVIEGDLPQARLPMIPGHQVVGIVDALGPDCRRLQLGQRIGIAWLRHTCGHCAYCISGRENLCDFARFTGYHEFGGYAQYAVVPEDFAYPLPESFDDLQAAPLLCAGIIGYRALQRSRLPQKGRLALYGFGSSAHVVLQIAQYRGAEVYVVTRGERHQQLAREMGAVWVGSHAEDLPVAVDSAILFAPAGSLVPPAMAKLNRGGTLALAGIHLSTIPPLDYEDTLFYERDLRSVTSNTRQDGQELLNVAAEIPLRPHASSYPLTEANRALQDLKADRLRGTGVLVVS